ncbi:hypothetical protein [Planococcus sp. YIM B11945]|uniref:hypothetical protein n=1 Tax=Planococcus sp. YIM B11945 TaxID=3435410 RepID=UPI003D7DAA4C
MEPFTREEMMKRLDFFIGTWNMDVIHPHLLPNPISGRSTFEWLEEKYIVQRTHIDKSEFPDNMIVYDFDPNTGHYLLHYFDSRGITRLYQMTLENGAWTMLRDKADFTPLSFFQRFIGTIDEVGKVIEGSWEASDDGVEWEHDLKVVYRKE